MSLNGKMGDAHEGFLAGLLGGRRTKASGAVWKDQMDGRHNRLRERFAFAWDGKSTLGKSIGVTRKMWEKAREQASGERPMLALRFYDTEALDVGEDLVVLGVHDFAEVLQQANHVEPVRVFVISGRPEQADRFPKPQPEPRPLMVVDGRVLALDHFAYTLRQGRPPKVVAELEGRSIPLEDREVEVYVDGLLKVTTGLMERMEVW